MLDSLIRNPLALSIKNFLKGSEGNKEAPETLKGYIFKQIKSLIKAPLDLGGITSGLYGLIIDKIPDDWYFSLNMFNQIKKELYDFFANILIPGEIPDEYSSMSQTLQNYDLPDDIGDSLSTIKQTRFNNDETDFGKFVLVLLRIKNQPELLYALISAML